MRRAILVGNGLHRDNMFNLHDVDNRDHCYAPYVPLALLFRADGLRCTRPIWPLVTWHSSCIWMLHLRLRSADLPYAA